MLIKQINAETHSVKELATIFAPLGVEPGNTFLIRVCPDGLLVDNLPESTIVTNIMLPETWQNDDWIKGKLIGNGEVTSIRLSKIDDEHTVILAEDPKPDPTKALVDLYDLLSLARTHDFSVVVSCPVDRDYEELRKIIGEWGMPFKDVVGHLNLNRVHGRSYGSVFNINCRAGTETNMGHSLTVATMADKEHHVFLKMDKPHMKLTFMASFAVYAFRNNGVWEVHCDRWRSGPTPASCGLLVDVLKKFDLKAIADHDFGDRHEYISEAMLTDRNRYA